MGKISDYARVLAAKLADVFVVDQTDNGTTETKSATVEQIGTAIGTLQNFADLDTSNKTLVDSINEIASYTPVYGNTASGAIATFDTSLALPLQDCTIAINTSTGVGGANIQRCNNAFASLWDIDSSFKGSVEFNQLILNGNFPTGTESDWLSSGIYKTFANNKAEITIASTATQSANLRQDCLSNRENHVIFVTQTITTPRATKAAFYVGETTTSDIEIPANITTTASTIVKTQSSYTTTLLYFYFNRERMLSTDDVITIENAFAVDLTEMFGSTIADYIYSLEQATTGAGVAFFKSLYPNDYYDYDSGTSKLVGDNLAYADWSSLGTITEGSLDVTTGKLTVTTGSMASGDYQITPIAINQISGTNNIFCDTGNTSVVYACSLKDYIDGQ